MPWAIDREKCTGCGICTELEGYFEMDVELKSRMINPGASRNDTGCIEAAEDCPTEAIYWVDDH